MSWVYPYIAIKHRQNIIRSANANKAAGVTDLRVGKGTDLKIEGGRG